MNRTDALNYVIKEKGYISYLEIGIQHGNNFNSIKCRDKVGVDPNVDIKGVFKKTSDQFFESNSKKFDLIFIDGMHTHAQSMKDFEQAKKVLNKGGAIAFHDALPHNEEYTKPHWCGDVYKTCLKVSQDHYVITFSEDHGVCFVYPDFKAVKVSGESINAYPGIDKLKSLLNAVDDLSSLVEESISTDFSKAELWNTDAENQQNDKVKGPAILDELTDDELKAEYKRLNGGKSARGKFNRENMIKKIYELQS